MWLSYNPCQMKVQNDTISAISPPPNKKVNPKVSESMIQYQALKKQLYAHFFDGKLLNISNRDFGQAYSSLYNLLNDSSFVISNDKIYQSVEYSFLNAYKNDLKAFAERIYEQLSKNRGISAEVQIEETAKWINIFARFNHWIFKMFMIIERNAMMAQGVKLYFEGIKILKEHVFDRIYGQLYQSIFAALELYKEGKLRAFQPLQLVIRYIGLVGFSKFKLVEMVKMQDGRFQYNSKQDQGQASENPYETGYFKTNFLTRLVRDLKAKYTDIVRDMLNLSTPDYFEKAKQYVQKQENTADHFYGFKSVRETVIRYVLEILVVEHAQELLKKEKSGLAKMMREKDIRNLVKIYQLLKKANMQRVFFKQFQNYIEGQGNAIMSRISPQDERTMKKESIQAVVRQVINFNVLVDNLRGEIDIRDAELQKSQNTGFQSFCNTNNKMCTYLAYYADMMLKKDESGIGSQDIVSQINKISKYLHSYDYFMNMHQKLLGLRLLYDSFKNQEAEFALISMLKNEAGITATSKISNMIQDQKSSEAWNLQFQLKNTFGFGFDVMMLTSGSWEINDPKCGKTCVPPQLLPAVEAFENKFFQKMPNRSVSWIFNHGRAIVQFIPNSKAKYILIVNNYQLLIVLYLRRHEYSSAKYGELLSSLRIEDEAFFKNSLLSLLKTGVLVKSGVPMKIQSKQDEVKLNMQFKYKTVKVGCSIIPKYSEKAKEMSAPISAERCILIDAALVKFMKQRRRAPYQQVIIEVQKMCRTFKAQVQQIKTRIQNCQQRQFIQRDANDMNILIYKP